MTDPTEVAKAERIGKAVQALRPRWAAKSVQTLILTRWAHLAAEDVALMLVTAAMRPDLADVPAAIDGPGPWRDVVRQAAKAETYTPAAKCPEHPQHRAIRCPDCTAKHAEVAAAGAEAARAALRAARTKEA